MKYIFLILLIVGNLTYGQDFIVKPKPKEKWARIGLITSSILFSAAGDALQDQGENKMLAHGMKTASSLSLLAIPLVSHVSKKKAFKYVLSYGLMRYALFDITYNTTRGLPYGYIGTTSVHDRVVGEIPKPILFLTKGTALWISIELNNREVR